MKKNNSILFISNFLVIILLLGVVLPSVIAGPLGKPKSESRDDDGPCETCKQAVVYTVEYMIEHVNENLDDKDSTYILKTVDAVLFIFEGLIEGLKKSGYNLNIDESDLKATINRYINKMVGQQKFNVTLFLAKLGAIAVGITVYLLLLCFGNNAKNIQTSRSHRMFLPLCIARLNLCLKSIVIMLNSA